MCLAACLPAGGLLDIPAHTYTSATRFAPTHQHPPALCYCAPPVLPPFPAAGTHARPCTAASGSVKYVWPIQQPISDFGTIKKRMTMVRESLGWKIVGCELVECYAE